jgi:hypothetical protein
MDMNDLSWQADEVARRRDRRMGLAAAQDRDVVDLDDRGRRELNDILLIDTGNSSHFQAMGYVIQSNPRRVGCPAVHCYIFVFYSCDVLTAAHPVQFIFGQLDVALLVSLDRGIGRKLRLLLLQIFFAHGILLFMVRGSRE